LEKGVLGRGGSGGLVVGNESIQNPSLKSEGERGVHMAKILILDWYSSIRMLLSEELIAEGNAVTSTGDPNSIIKLNKTFNPDLIVMDPYFYGEMRWDLVARIIRQQPHPPILIHTSTPPDGNLPQFHVSGWVMKSSIFDNLKNMIVMAMGKSVALKMNPALGLISLKM
jgi:CheY-like chemotaxis protein